MKRLAMAAFAVVLLVGAAGRGRAGGETELKALQGSWSMVSLVAHGETVPKDQVKRGRLVVEGDRYAPTFHGHTVAATLLLDTSRVPKSVDFKFLDGPQKGKTVKGIFSVVGDTLTVCRGLTEGDARPTRFEAPADSGHLLVVFKHAGTGSKVVADRNAVAREVANLQGAWRMASAVNDGKAIAGDQARKVTVTVAGMRHTVRVGDQVVAHDVGFEVDPHATPKAVTDTVVDGAGKEMVIRGIYKIEGDTLTSCVAAPGHERPTAFDAGQGTGRSLRVFRREPAAPAEEAEYARFAGTWVFDRVKVDGNDPPPGAFKNARLILSGNMWISEDAKGTGHGVFRVDVSKTPKTIDITFTDGPDPGTTVRGVYELETDTYKLCVGRPGKPRPDGWVSRPGSGTVFEVLKRQKNGNPQARPAQGLSVTGRPPAQRP